MYQDFVFVSTNIDPNTSATTHLYRSISSDPNYPVELSVRTARTKKGTMVASVRLTTWEHVVNNDSTGPTVVTHNSVSFNFGCEVKTLAGDPRQVLRMIQYTFSCLFGTVAATNGVGIDTGRTKRWLAGVPFGDSV
jgi:hypothetical protein